MTKPRSDYEDSIFEDDIFYQEWREDDQEDSEQADHTQKERIMHAIFAIEKIIDLMIICEEALGSDVAREGINVRVSKIIQSHVYTRLKNLLKELETVWIEL